MDKEFYQVSKKAEDVRTVIEIDHLSVLITLTILGCLGCKVCCETKLVWGNSVITIIPDAIII